MAIAWSTNSSFCSDVGSIGVSAPVSSLPTGLPQEEQKLASFGLMCPQLLHCTWITPFLATYALRLGIARSFVFPASIGLLSRSGPATQYRPSDLKPLRLRCRDGTKSTNGISIDPTYRVIVIASNLASAESENIFRGQLELRPSATAQASDSSFCAGLV